MWFVLTCRCWPVLVAFRLVGPVGLGRTSWHLCFTCQWGVSHKDTKRGPCQPVPVVLNLFRLQSTKIIVFDFEMGTHQNNHIWTGEAPPWQTLILWVKVLLLDWFSYTDKYCQNGGRTTRAATRGDCEESVWWNSPLCSLPPITGIVSLPKRPPTIWPSNSTLKGALKLTKWSA